VTDFASRRLVQMMETNLRARGYTFVRWSLRGDSDRGQVYEFTFLTPCGLQEVTTGISLRELETTEHPVKTIAGVLSNRIMRKVERLSPPSPA